MVKASSVLLADIGGTHTRFALLASNGRPERVVSWDNNNYASLENAIASYLAENGARPQAAVLAVAAPITGRDIALTNRNWRFNLDELAGRFGWARIHAINDFEAQAWALAQLQEGDYRRIGDGARAQSAPPASSPAVKVVLGPGTGLGVAALIPVSDGWRAIPTEGGHVSFGAANKDEDAVFARLRERGPVSAEMVVSGMGLPRLHSALHPGTPPLTAQAIVAQAKAGDAAAGATIKLFVRLLGRFAGDVALTFKALGGVYIAGGVTGKLGALFDEDIFRGAFEAHPPHEELLATLPTYLVTVAHPGLVGCAALAMAEQA
ncbi:MAG TPA: ROK family protein [Xanthobacteraceae bacterium]|nr:ROK family protein [Xanthobacteraceae bacterium]